jgi:hypothetical protein
MYQVNASYVAVAKQTRKLNWLQRLLGTSEIEITEKLGSIAFMAETIKDVVSKLEYLTKQLDNALEITIKKI